MPVDDISSHYHGQADAEEKQRCSASFDVCALATGPESKHAKRRRSPSELNRKPDRKLQSELTLSSSVRRAALCDPAFANGPPTARRQGNYDPDEALRIELETNHRR